MLENVRLKVEAFDYLQLPFVFTAGCIGRLEVQVRTPCTCTMTESKGIRSYYSFGRLDSTLMQQNWRKVMSSVSIA